MTDQQREQRDVELGERQIGEHKLGVKTGRDGTSQAPASTASTSGRASRAFHGGRRCRRTSYTRPTASRIPEPQPTTDRMRSGEDGAARCRSDTARGQSHTRTHGRRASTQSFTVFVTPVQTRLVHVTLKGAQCVMTQKHATTETAQLLP